jgi:hypothetical protein
VFAAVVDLALAVGVDGHAPRTQAADDPTGHEVAASLAAGDPSSVGVVELVAAHQGFVDAG